MDEDSEDLAEFRKKNATQNMIFLPHYKWAENTKYQEFSYFIKKIIESGREMGNELKRLF